MKSNRFNKKFRSVLTVSLAGLSAVGGSAGAMQCVPVPGPQGSYSPGQPLVIVQPQAASQQDSVGDYLMKKQVAKDLKAVRNAQVWTKTDTVVQVACLGGAVGGSLAYNAHTGALKDFYDTVSGSGGLEDKYIKNPFEHDDRDKSAMKTVEEWGIKAVDIALLPSKHALDASIVCYRKDLQQGEGEDNEPNDSRIFVEGKKDPDTGKEMREHDRVVRSRYRFDRIKDLQISEIQKKIIKGEAINNGDIIWDGIKIGGPVALGLSLSICHGAFKMVQKAASSVGNVIDKQQTISAIKATRS